MTDRPILFSAPMVRALLAGTKTQTRRDLTKTFEKYPHLVGYETDGTLKQLDGKIVPHVEFVHSLLGLWHPQDNPGGRSGWYVPLKAAIGDHLWVREAWRTLQQWDNLKPSYLGDDISKITFEADPENRNKLWAFGKLRPSMFMPRWASRLTLTVTDVRVERLQDISEADAIAEGCKQYSSSTRLSRPFNADWKGIYRQGYAELWNDINGAGSWEANPWIVAYTFTVHHSNIGQMAKEAA